MLWVAGLMLPSLYIVLILNFRKLFNFLKTLNFVKTVFLLFIIFQIISILLSVLYDFFTFSRLFAIIHNFVSFTFFIVGYFYANYFLNTKKLQKAIRVFFYFTAISSILVFLFSFYTKIYIQYPGLLYFLTGVKNDITQVTYGHLGYVLNIPVPRSRIMGSFPNTTAIMLLLFFSLYRLFNEKNKFLSAVLLIGACLTTGSRMATLIAIILTVVQYVNSKNKLLILMGIFLLFLPPSYFAIKELIAMREDSNVVRRKLYIDSIELMTQTNLLFGTGIKPRLPDIANGKLPVGSHSTIIGYIVKNGIFGLILILIVYASLFGLTLYSIYYFIFKKFKGGNSFFLVTCTFLISIIFITDDFDSYELMPLFFGILIYFYERDLKTYFLK